jgi:ornithine--oxo-acid transaminase
MTLEIEKLFFEREAERYDLHARYLNEQMVRVLKTIGFDQAYQRGKGQYLYDRRGQKYLDLLSGWGVFALGRNHPVIRDTLKHVLDSDFPNLVQMDVSALAGVLAERLLRHVPHLEKVFFANSGTESVEASIKFARAATGRDGIVYCSHAYHGLSYGSLSVNGDAIFRNGFGSLLPGCAEVPFNDLVALERALASKTIAAFIVEPIQGKGVTIPADGYLRSALDLCRKHGTLFIADEIQTGLGRTGRFLACEHWGIEPDIVLLSKSLSGGHVPVGAVLTRKWIFDRVFDRMDRAVVHGSTFAKNDMAMAAGLATLEVIESEGLMQNAQRIGARLLSTFGQSTISWVKLASLASRLSRWCRATASSVIGSFGLPYSYSPWWLITMCLISVTSCFGNDSPESRSASRTLSSIIVMASTMWPRSWPSSV